MIPGVTICIPGIPRRAPLMVRAFASVMRQTRPVAAVSVTNDLERRGASWNRNRALAASATEWTGFLDDDDELYPFHCEVLLDLAEESGAGLVWGWFDVSGGHDPLDGRGKPFDPDNPHTVPITYLVRTELLHDAQRAMGGFLDDTEATGAWDVQDKALFVWMAREGGTANTARATWRWNHNDQNTSGLGTRELAMRNERLAQGAA